MARERSREEGSARLLIVCPDQPGIVAAVSGWLFEQGANITDSAQHSTDPEGGTFFMRMEFVLDRLGEARSELQRQFEHDVASRFGMQWRLSYATDRPRVAILASKQDHCVLDLLWRWRRGEF